MELQRPSFIKQFTSNEIQLVKIPFMEHFIHQGELVILLTSTQIDFAFRTFVQTIHQVLYTCFDETTNNIQ